MSLTVGSKDKAVRIGFRSWVMLLVAAGAGMVFYLDRQSIAILKSTISEALDLSNTDFAWLITAYMVPYTLCYLVSGRLIDKWGTRKGTAVFLLGMGVATFGCAAARNMPEMATARALLGMTESGISPAIILLLSLWFPAAKRAFALTSCQAIQSLAPIVAPPLMASLALHGNWRLAFVIPAIFSLFVAVLWWALDRNAPFASIATSQRDASSVSGYVESFKSLFRVPALRALIIARILSDPFYFFLNYWYTGFLQEHAGWDLEAVGRITWIPWAFVPLANIAVAYWSDRQTKKLGDAAAARNKTLRYLACLAPAAIAAPFVADSSTAVITMIALSLFMTTCWIAISGVMISELAPAGTVATAIGVLSALSGLTSVLFNQIAGSLVDNFGYTILFVIGGCLHPLAGFILWTKHRNR